MAEKEYIEAKDLDGFRNEIMEKFLSLCNYNDYNKLTLLRIGETIDEIYYKYVSKPPADVVEVVRCKDCRSWEECGIDPITNYHFGYCRHFQWQDEDDSRETNGQDFCSYGERKKRCGMKKRAIYLGFSQHACDAYYKCPVCGKGFCGWTVFGQEKNENGTKKYCPHCKEELDGLE